MPEYYPGRGPGVRTAPGQTRYTAALDLILASASMSSRACRHLAPIIALTTLWPALTVQADDRFFQPLPVVLSASRLPQPLSDTPAAMTVMDAEFIAATGYRDLARLMRLVPGFQVGQERGNAHWVTYHGLGMDYPVQMQLLVDGRASLTPSFVVNAERALLQDIASIEVVRGSNSAAYGSNAFLGVVNITTRDGSQNPGTRVQLNRGHPGIADASARHSAVAGPLRLRISANHEQDEGFADLHDARRTTMLNLRGELQLDARNELGLIAAASEGVRELGYAGSMFDTAAEREAREANRSLHLRWRHTPTAEEEWLFSAYFNRQRTRDSWRLDSTVNPPAFLPPGLLPPLQGTVGNSADNTQYNLEIEHRRRMDADTRLLWGAEWQRSVQESPFYYHLSGGHARNEHRLFANLEWRAAPRLLWNLGGMIEHLQGDAAKFAPRVFLNWQAAPELTWRIGHSRAWRQPGLFERNADVQIVDDTGKLLQWRQQPNRGLRPQRIDAFEIGLLGVLDEYHSTLDVRLFHERIDDLIVRNAVAAAGPSILPPALAARLGSTRWENYTGEVRLSGIEYQLRTRPWRGTEFILAHSVIDRHAADERIRSNTAPYSASLSWLQRSGPWQSMLSVLRMGPIDAGFSYVPSFRYTVPAYTTVDWSVGREFRYQGRPLELRLSAINLLGHHQELADRPLQAQPEYQGRAANEVSRQVFLSLRADF